MFEKKIQRKLLIADLIHPDWTVTLSIMRRSYRPASVPVQLPTIIIINNIIIIVITAIKRSLGQGNVFRSICQSFCQQGGLSLGICLQLGSTSREVCLQAVLRPGGSASRWVGQTPPQSKRQAVHIILECFLVTVILFTCRRPVRRYQRSRRHRRFPSARRGGSPSDHRIPPVRSSRSRTRNQPTAPHLEHKPLPLY